MASVLVLPDAVVGSKAVGIIDVGYQGSPHLNARLEVFTGPFPVTWLAVPQDMIVLSTNHPLMAYPW